MARIRYLKPDFFKDEDLKDLPFVARLFYQGLWIQADREGRGEDRPERLKIEIMPYDDIDAEQIMQLLAKPKKYSKRSYIVRYEIAGEKYYQIVNWQKHQKPHKTERESVIPPVPNELLTLNQLLTNGCPTNSLVGNRDEDGKGNGEEKVNNQTLSACAVSLKNQNKELLDSIDSQGFNIYQLINRFKNEANWAKEKNIPDEVLIKICRQYERDKDIIRNPYPWFIKVLQMESAAFFANKNVEEGRRWKEQGVGKFGDILKQIVAAGIG